MAGHSHQTGQVISVPKLEIAFVAWCGTRYWSGKPSSFKLRVQSGRLLPDNKPRKRLKSQLDSQTARMLAIPALPVHWSCSCAKHAECFPNLSSDFSTFFEELIALGCERIRLRDVMIVENNSLR